MADTSKIEWTEATWNPITGCKIVSPACTHCYAMKLAGTRLKHHPSRQGLTKPSKAGPVWTGGVIFNAQWLTQPINWRRGRMIFVCAHSDLFYEEVLDYWRDKIYAVMLISLLHEKPRGHTFQVLTKRAEGMHAYLTSPDLAERVARAGGHIMQDGDGWSDVLYAYIREHGLVHPSIWHGVSAERQKEWDERLMWLAQTPSAIRFVSVEPMLGPIDVGNAFDPPGFDETYQPIDWVICGGESAGPRARAWDDEWARHLRDQCKLSGVAFFMKQVRNKGPIPSDLLVREWPKAHGRLIAA